MNIGKIDFVIGSYKDTIVERRAVAANKFITLPDRTAKMKLNVERAAKESSAIINFLRSNESERTPPNDVINTSGTILHKIMIDMAVELSGASLSTDNRVAIRMNQSPVCCIQ